MRDTSGMIIHTVGHSTLPLEQFLTLLRGHGIEQVVDVRRFPGSRRHPHFGAEALERALTAAAIHYIHEPELGGRRTASDGSQNTAWRSAAFRAYADYMATSAFASALDRLLGYADRRSTAIMCAEAVPWRCHRQLIADALVARGHDVRHITTAARADSHHLSPHAVVDANGAVSYPGSPAEQQRLL